MSVTSCAVWMGHGRRLRRPAPRPSRGFIPSSMTLCGRSWTPAPTETSGGQPSRRGSSSAMSMRPCSAAMSERRATSVALTSTPARRERRLVSSTCSRFPRAPWRIWPTPRSTSTRGFSPPRARMDRPAWRRSMACEPTSAKRRWVEAAGTRSDRCRGSDGARRTTVINRLERTLGLGPRWIVTHIMSPPEVREGGLVAADDFDDLFQRERTPMVRLAFLMLGSEALAEEVVQDGFVAVLERWDGLDNPGAYLRRCVVNGCIGHTRRAKRWAPSPIVTEAELATDHMLDAVRRLAPQRRAMVVLRFYADLTQDEIADLLRVPVGT